MRHSNTKRWNPLVGMPMLLSMLLTACGGPQSEWNGKQAEKKALAQTDSAINRMDADALKRIHDGMAAAEDSLSWYEYYSRLGKYHLLTQTPDSMLPYIDATIAFTNRSKPTPRTNSLRAMALECKASFYQLFRQDVRTLEALHQQAYDAAAQSDEPEFMPNILANMADIYVQNNELPRAAHLYRRALFLTDSLHLPEAVNGTLYIGLGSIYQNLGDYEQARKYFEKTEQMLPMLDPNMQVVALNNFGNYYYYRRDYPEALRKFQQMRQTVAQYEGDNSFDMYLCKINLADVYLNLDSIEQARQLVDETEPFFRQYGVGTGIYYANTIRIGMAVKQERLSEVQRILSTEAIDEPIEQNLQKVRNSYLRQYYVKTGNLMAALQNKESEDQTLDSIEANRAYMRASEIIQRFTEDTLALHHRIALDEKEADVRQAYTLVIALAALALILALAFVLRAINGRKKQLQSEMDILKFRLENARNRISPHFVFNVLNNRLSTTDPQQTDELLALSKLIRANLDISQDTMISLQEELDFVNSYIDVERHVLGSDFTFSINVPEDIDPIKVKVPSMFVQILVENAIKHGLKGIDRPQQLRIDVSSTSGESAGNSHTVTICVADNGRGFDYRSQGRDHGGTGLTIIRQTMAALNQQSRKPVIDFDIRNTHDADGNPTGCEARLTVVQTPTTH